MRGYRARVCDLEPARLQPGGHSRERWQVEGQRLAAAGTCTDDHSAAARLAQRLEDRRGRVQLEPGQVPVADLRGGDVVLQCAPAGHLAKLVEAVASWRCRAVGYRRGATCSR